MGVYNRDGINYSAMLQNAIANRNAAAQRQAQYLMNKGKLWGDTATNVGKIFGRGLASSYDELDEDTAELEKLKREREAIIMEQERLKQERSRLASAQMEGYRPSYINYKPNESVLPDLPKLQEFYDQHYNEDYDADYEEDKTNPYTYVMMQDYYRRSR